jgi:D-glycero-D-manno-heptose 1,7-bisphosphate phosphatase
MADRLGGERYGQGPQRRFVVLDRDGTIIVERHYLSDPDAVELLPGVAKALRRLADLGLGLVVVTNQSGIGRGLFDQERLNLIHQRLGAILETARVHLDGIYVCPHRPEDHCSCRKPKTGLLELAAQELVFDPAACFVIGDKASDIELGGQLGATTVLVRTGYGLQLASPMNIHPDHIVDDLWQAALVIERTVHWQQRFTAGATYIDASGIPPEPF